MIFHNIKLVLSNIGNNRDTIEDTLYTIQAIDDFNHQIKPCPYPCIL